MLIKPLVCSLANKRHRSGRDTGFARRPLVGPRSCRKLNFEPFCFLLLFSRMTTSAPFRTRYRTRQASRSVYQLHLSVSKNAMPPVGCRLVKIAQWAKTEVMCSGIDSWVSSSLHKKRVPRCCEVRGPRTFKNVLFLPQV